jgi:hypothetical protein
MDETGNEGPLGQRTTTTPSGEVRLLWCWVQDDGVSVFGAGERRGATADEDPTWFARGRVLALRIALGVTYESYSTEDSADRDEDIQSILAQGGPDVRPLYGASVAEWDSVAPYEEPLPAWML